MADEPTEEELIAALEARANGIEQNDGFGLDKTARLTAQRERRAEEDRPTPLDPPFPFQSLAFDPRFAKFNAFVSPSRMLEP